MSKRANSGVGLATVLFLIFLVLKLTHNITWAWVWVFSPLWISFALWGMVLICTGIIALLMVANARRK